MKRLFLLLVLLVFSALNLVAAMGQAQVPIQSKQRIVVYIDEQRLECWEEKRRVCSFPVTTGNVTMLGTFVVYSKAPNNVNKDPIDPMALGPTMWFEVGTMTAIHGWPWYMQSKKWADDPKEIGTSYRQPGSCVMLLRPAMSKVYKWAHEGAVVEILQRKAKS